jgi:hypothetical protein
MSAWVMIYCKRSLADVTPQQVLAGIDDADWWTLPEIYGIEDEAVVDAALKHLRIKAFPDDEPGKHLWELHYRPNRPRGVRQVQIERYSDPSLVAEEVQEERRALSRARKPDAKLIREHLAKVRETVGIELGWDQLDTMAAVLAYEVATWLARVGSGLINDHNDHWWRLTRGGTAKSLSP